MATTAERLKEIMALRHLRQVDIVRLAEPICRESNLTLSKSDLSQFISGKVQPSQWKLTILGKALDVSEAWLMGEDVPMERVVLVSVTGTPPEALNDEEKILVTRYRAATEERRRIVMQILSNE